MFVAIKRVRDVHLEPQGSKKLLKQVDFGNYLLTAAKTIRSGG